MEAELEEPESSTGPKKSRFKRDEPPLAAESGRPKSTDRESERAETCTHQRVGHVKSMGGKIHRSFWNSDLLLKTEEPPWG